MKKKTVYKDPELQQADIPEMIVEKLKNPFVERWSYNSDYDYFMETLRKRMAKTTKGIKVSGDMKVEEC